MHEHAGTTTSPPTLLGALEPAETAELERHLDGCEHCRERRSLARAGADLLARVGRAARAAAGAARAGDGRGPAPTPPRAGERVPVQRRHRLRGFAAAGDRARRRRGDRRRSRRLRAARRRRASDPSQELRGSQSGVDRAVSSARATAATSQVTGLTQLPTSERLPGVGPATGRRSAVVGCSRPTGRHGERRDPAQSRRGRAVLVTVEPEAAARSRPRRRWSACRSRLNP